MSFVIAAPEALTAAASDIAGIGSNLTSAHAAAAAPTTGVLAAASDEVSTQIAAFFSAHGQGYQRLSTQAAEFHDQFVQSLTSGASKYAAAESSAAQTLLGTMNTSAQKVLGHPLIGGGAAGLLGGGGLPSLLGGGGAPSSLGTLALRPTGGLGALTSLSPLLRAGGITNAAAAPAAFDWIANAIKNSYTFIEPWVRWGFSVAAWAVGWLPWIGILAPQINFLYNLFEPMVQSALFNTLDWITGTISFGQGLTNFFNATAASIGAFINTEINWLLSFLPPWPPFSLPPFPPFP